MLSFSNNPFVLCAHYVLHRIFAFTWSRIWQVLVKDMLKGTIKAQTGFYQAGSAVNECGLQGESDPKAL